jgi:uncharacterized protein YbjT (DUF2867 family)
MPQELICQNYRQTKPYSILVTGATGFIGSRLLDLLTKKGYTVKTISRKSLPDKKSVKFVRADLFNEEELRTAMEGVEIAYYLVHSMEGESKQWREFASRERVQAQNFLLAASSAKVKRIIYLGGLVNEKSLELSPHMRSRKEVGEILASGDIPVTELRASLIIGAGGGSYAMLRYLVERLRVMVCPRWVKSLAQPIAVDDVIEYLAGCMEHQETSGRIFDIGGPENLTYEQLMRVYAAYLNKNLFVIQIPFLTTRLSSYWVDLITLVKASLARPLIDSLVHDSVVKENSITDIIPLRLKSVREAIDIATKEMKQQPPPQEQKESKTSFRINQNLLMLSLVAMLGIGTTYYWLDNRSDVYEPGWLVLAGLWFIAVVFATVFVKNKTRLGYLIAGTLSWITLAFWMFDSCRIVFDGPVLAGQINLYVVERNFAGIIVSAITIAASHNVFHKIHSHQFRGRPA